MRELLPKGTRVRLLAMPDDPRPVPEGTLGTVEACYQSPAWAQIMVKWDNGRYLGLCVPPDRYEIVEEKPNWEEVTS